MSISDQQFLSYCADADTQTNDGQHRKQYRVSPRKVGEGLTTREVGWVFPHWNAVAPRISDYVPDIAKVLWQTGKIKAV